MAHKSIPSRQFRGRDQAKLRRRRTRRGDRQTRLSLEQLEVRNLLTTYFTPQFGAEATTFVPGLDTAEPLSSVPLEFVFWGGNYWSTSTGQQEQTQILNAAQTICNSGFFKDEAAEYDTDGKLHVDVSDVDLTNPSNGFSQSQLNGVFQNAIDNGPLPESDNSNFGQAEYIVVTPPGVYSASGPTVGGYNTGTAHTHNFNVVSENFIWVGGGNSGTFNLDTYTTTLSHEVAELTVNPVAYEFGTGTYRFGWEVNPGASFPNPPGNSNQICDYEAQNYTERLLGVDVQSYWSNLRSAGRGGNFSGVVGEVNRQRSSPALHDFAAEPAGSKCLAGAVSCGKKSCVQRP